MGWCSETHPEAIDFITIYVIIVVYKVNGPNLLIELRYPRGTSLLMPMNPHSHDSTDIGKQTGSLRPLIQSVIILTLLVSSATPASAYAATQSYLAKNAPNFIDDVKNEYGDIVKIAALLQDYDEDMILSVIVIESEGNLNAVSHKGAQGLMQLMPATAESLGVTDPHDPFQNVLAGTRYLKELQTRYGFKSPQEALVAYNMGPTRAKRWLSQYPAEDYLYVQKVMYVHGVIAKQKREQRAFVKVAESQLAEESKLATLSKPLLTRPRSLSLAAFPLVISNDRRDDVREE
jgi:hypothetical protein